VPYNVTLTAGNYLGETPTLLKVVFTEEGGLGKICFLIIHVYIILSIKFNLYNLLGCVSAKNYRFVF